MKTAQKILSIIVAIAVVFSLSACGGTQDTQSGSHTDKPAEKPPLLENITSQQWENILPAYDNPQTDEDFMALWKYRTLPFFEGGSLYDGIHTVKMTKERLECELTEDGYVLKDTSNARTTETETDSYIITASKAAGAEYISSLGVQFIGMDADGFDWNSVDDVNSKIYMGNSQDILGITMNEMFSNIGLTEDMINWVKSAEDGSRSWYEDNNDFWYISYSEEHLPKAGVQAVLNISRAGSHLEESVTVINCGDYVGTFIFDTHLVTEADLSNRAKFADKYRQAE